MCFIANFCNKKSCFLIFNSVTLNWWSSSRPTNLSFWKLLSSICCFKPVFFFLFFTHCFIFPEMFSRKFCCYHKVKLSTCRLFISIQVGKFHRFATQMTQLFCLKLLTCCRAETFNLNASRDDSDGRRCLKSILRAIWIFQYILFFFYCPALCVCVYLSVWWSLCACVSAHAIYVKIVSFLIRGVTLSCQ